MDDLFRPSLAETFDMKGRIEGFDATISHLPVWAGRLLSSGAWLDRVWIDLCLLAFVSASIAYLLVSLYVMSVLTPLTPLLVVGGLLAVRAADAAVEGLEVLQRQAGERLYQALEQRSRLRLSASRLHVGAESWPLSEVDELRASGSTIHIVARGGRPLVLASGHSPWACAELCRLINTQLRWHRDGQQAPPPALQALRDRGAQRKASV